MAILNFWTKFAQKGSFQSKTEKVNNTNEFSIFELVQVPNFSLNWQFCFFGPSLPKKGTSSPKTDQVSSAVFKISYPKEHLPETATGSVL